MILYLLPNVLKERTSLLSRVRVRWTHNPEAKGGTFLGKAGKKSQDTMQQPTRLGSSAVTQCNPQISLFVLLETYMISDYFNFIVYCVVFVHERLERYKFYI